MLISDWSSDVCSSDLHRIEIAAVQRFLKIGPVLDHLLLTFGQDGGICDIKLVTNGFFPGHAISSHYHCCRHGQILTGNIGETGSSNKHIRSVERRVGKEWVCTVRSRWCPEY